LNELIRKVIRKIEGRALYTGPNLYRSNNFI
jgi:hypothetical protein